MGRGLTIASALLLVVAWPVGVILLWLLPYWSRREKTLGTLLLPGGFLAALLVYSSVRTNCQSATGEPIPAGAPGCPAPIGYQITHPTPWWGFNHVFGPLLLMLLILVPIVTATVLAVRALRRDTAITRATS